MLEQQQIVKIKNMLSQANGLLITAGAGMGIDSGLPDFRGNHGMWQAYPELGKKRMDFTSIANPNAFYENPNLAWGFYGHRLKMYSETQPHQGFNILKQMSEVLNLPYFIFTSNVDGQFQKAGFNDEAIYECHGSIHHLQCLDACENKIWTAHAIQPRIDHHRCEWLGNLPRCPSCHGLARPNILMFDDFDWINQRTIQQRLKLEQWLKLYQHPVVIEIDAGTAIPTVRNFSERFAHALIRINLREPEIFNQNGIAIKASALESLKFLFHELMS